MIWSIVQQIKKMAEPIKVRAIYKFKGTNNDEVSHIFCHDRATPVKYDPIAKRQVQLKSSFERSCVDQPFGGRLVFSFIFVLVICCTILFVLHVYLERGYGHWGKVVYFHRPKYAIFSYSWYDFETFYFQLKFKKDDIITITQKEDGGWWEGTLGNKTRTQIVFYWSNY